MKLANDQFLKAEREFMKKYQMTDINSNDLIGQGAFSIVKQGINQATKEKVAVKIIDKSKRNTSKDIQNLQREIVFHSRLNHENIIKFLEFFETQQYVFLVLEYAENGSLFQLLRKQYLFPEAEARPFIIQICQALKYTHEQKIMHRDVKLENVLLDKNNNVKLCDYGWCCQISSDKKQTFCGTYEYMAPEIFLNQPYDQAVDIWALGVIIYELLHGVSPFHGETPQAVGQNVIDRKIHFKTDISQMARDLMMSILNLNPDERPNFNTILNHPWLKGSSISPTINNKNNNNNTLQYPSKQIVHLGIGVPPTHENHFQIQENSQILTQKSKGLQLLGQKQSLIDDDIFSLGVPVFSKVQAQKPIAIMEVDSIISDTKDTGNSFIFQKQKSTSSQINKSTEKNNNSMNNENNKNSPYFNLNNNDNNSQFTQKQISLNNQKNYNFNNNTELNSNHQIKQDSNIHQFANQNGTQQTHYYYNTNITQSELNSNKKHTNGPDYSIRNDYNTKKY